jgi:hypothetical protein
VERGLSLRLGLGAEATGADVEFNRSTTEVDGLLMDVGPEHSARHGSFPLPPSGVPVADVPPENGSLATDVTLAGHRGILYGVSRFLLEFDCDPITQGWREASSH